MTEYKDTTYDKDKDKDKQDKEHDRSVLSHIVDAVGRKARERTASIYSDDLRVPGTSEHKASIYSIPSEIFTIDLIDRQFVRDDTIGTQRVYKKTSPNSLLTLYLPTREIILCGTSPTVLQGVVFVDPTAIQGYRIYAQLTLTFRYGREDEEVMGLRFCNEAIMSLYQIWPRTAEEIEMESLSPLQEALLKRLGDGAHPFTLNLTAQAPPSVQLVPAKRYYGAPIGTSYDVRCFIADKTDEKFHRRAAVKMGVRVIYRTDVFSSAGPENFAALVNNQLSPPPIGGVSGDDAATLASDERPPVHTSSSFKSKKSEKTDSFPRIRLSPKSFRFSGRFGRSKSEIERCPSDPFYNYSKSFQEYEFSGGPQGAVDKPFLLQEGRVGLRASLDKSWYTHGEDVIVTVNIRNDSRKTVRKVRVCAIQHVDVCMFNNGKFKNVVADADINAPGDRIVCPGGVLNSTIILKPKRGPTKNWIALEDTLQRSTEPDEITGAIAASALRSPTIYPAGSTAHTGPEDRNVFAIYVSYYVKVKLTLSGMGGELSLKLPFVLVHVDETENSMSKSVIDFTKESDLLHELGTKLNLDTLPNNRRSFRNASPDRKTVSLMDKIESVEDDGNGSATKGFIKRKLQRTDTSVVKDSSDDEDIDVGFVKGNAIRVVVEQSSPKEADSSTQIICAQVHSSTTAPTPAPTVSDL